MERGKVAAAGHLVSRLTSSKVWGTPLVRITRFPPTLDLCGPRWAGYGPNRPRPKTVTNTAPKSPQMKLDRSKAGAGRVPGPIHTHDPPRRCLGCLFANCYPFFIRVGRLLAQFGTGLGPICGIWHLKFKSGHISG